MTEHLFTEQLLTGRVALVTGGGTGITGGVARVLSEAGARVVVVSRRREHLEPAAERIRAALKFIDAKRLVPAPDCGMKYLARETAFGKLKALSEGAAVVRRELQ